MEGKEKLSVIKDEVFQLISSNMVPKAIARLKSLYKKTGGQYYDELLLLSRQFNDLNDRQIKGLIDDKDANIEKNRISHNLINLTNNLEQDVAVASYFGLVEEDAVPSGPSDSSSAGSNWRKLGWAVPILLVGLLIAFFMFSRKNEKKPNLTEKIVQPASPKEDRPSNRIKDKLDQPKTNTTEKKDENQDLPQPSVFKKSINSSPEKAKSLKYNNPIRGKLLSKKDIHYYQFKPNRTVKAKLVLRNPSNGFKPEITAFITNSNKPIRQFKISTKLPGEDIEKAWDLRANREYQIIINGDNFASFGNYGLLITERE